MDRRLSAACVALALVAPVWAYAAPAIQLVPGLLSYNLLSSDSSPTPAAITVNNTGTGSLAWTAAENPDVSWLSISPTTGGNGGTFTVTINKNGLAAGAYTAVVRVSDPAATNSSQDLSVTMTIRDVDANITTANAYDDAWQDGATGWVTTMRTVRASRPAGLAATPGFCIFLGDSITYANPFGQWARSGSGKTAADTAICNWMHANTGGSQSTNDGWYLARADVEYGRSYTASNGDTAAEYLTGGHHGLPSMDQMFTAGFTNPDGKQYRDVEIAVILLGTNDLNSYTDAQLAANLGTMVDKLEADGIIPVLTTIPPAPGKDAKVLTFVTAVRNLAQTRKLPLIDFYQEIMRRRPGQTWQGTLIGSGDVHPTASGGGYSTTSSPYSNNGAALSEVGYLLRCWLTVQKIAEVKALVIDTSPPAAPGNPGPGDGAVGVSPTATLSWSGELPGVTFDVYFDTQNPPQAKVASGQSVAAFTPTLQASTKYYWKVVATNNNGTTAGPVWSFTVLGPPAAPSNPSPADLTANASRFATLTWSGAASGVTFDVYLDTQNPPQAKVASEQSAAAFAPSLQPGTRYYWKVVAINAAAQTPGVVWTFRTGLTGDINLDGYVNVGDLQILVATWGKTNGEPGYDSRGDLDGNRTVNVGDLQVLVASWGNSQ